jgi:hypothetical protein
MSPLCAERFTDYNPLRKDFRKGCKTIPAVPIMATMITTAEAAQQLGVDVAKFHRLVAKHRIDPARKLPGIRGAMLWNPDDIAAITEVAQ